MTNPNEGATGDRGAKAAAVALAGFLAATGWFASTAPSLSPPPPIPASAPSTDFSAERARTHLREITRSPRPVGSPGHERARAYLVASLRELGLETEVQRTASVERYSNHIGAAFVQNIVARLPGRESSGAVVLMAHYDSEVHSYGASDAGNGVAAILETIRALRAGAPLRNDVIVLIMDAEEPHLYGARAYFAGHRWASETGIVLNAEGRGHTGPVVMFRTSDRNGRIVRTVANASPRPLGSSAWGELFQYMPADTDLSVVLDDGRAGVDFANVNGFTHYHTPLDSYDRADPRSLQHHGGFLLSLSRAFGDQDLSELASPNRAYLTLPLLGMVHYPESWTLPLSLVVLLLAAYVLVREQRHERLSRADAGWGALYFLALLAVGTLLVTGLWHLVATQLPEVRWFKHGAPYDGGFFLLAMGLLAAAGSVGLLARVGRKVSCAGLMVGPLAVLALFLIVTAVWQPGLSVMFLWPLLLTALGLWWVGGKERSSVGRPAILALHAVPVLFIMIPVVEGAEAMMTLSMVAAPAVLLFLTIGLLGLQLEYLARTLSWTLPLVLCLVGGGMLLTGVVTAGFDDERKKPNGVNYIADADEEAAWWYSLDPEPDEWTKRFLGSDPARTRLPAWAPQNPFGFSTPHWVGRAARVRHDAPEAVLLAERSTGAGRRVRLRITSPPAAYVTVMQFRDGPGVRVLGIDGRRVPPKPSGEGVEPDVNVQYFGPGAEGFEVEFDVAGQGAVELYLRSNIPGLPDVPEVARTERPGHMMAADRWSDLTQLQRTVRLEW